MSVFLVEKVRTVSDAKRDFYTHHTRPINSIYRRFVEELMVEMHLLSVNSDFHYDSIYALGVVTAFERFMQGYQPERDKVSIFDALCRAVNGDPEQYRRESGEIFTQAKQMSLQDIIARVSDPASGGDGNRLIEALQSIASQSNFKYSRLFGIGLYALLAETEPEIVKEKEKRDRAIATIAESLHLNGDKLQKDLELYSSNLDKMAQLLGVLEETLQADRKKRQPQDSSNDAQPSSES
jgi:photosystem II biogenesis protein Psp29